MAKPSQQAPALGVAQQDLEAATKEYKLAQKAFQLAAARLQKAEEAHTTAFTVLNATLYTVKSSAKVSSLHSQ